MCDLLFYSPEALLTKGIRQRQDTFTSSIKWVLGQNGSGQNGTDRIMN